MKPLHIIVLAVISLIFLPALQAEETQGNASIMDGIQKIRNGQVLLRYNQLGEVVEQYVFAKKVISYNHGQVMSSQINSFDTNHNITKTEVFDGENSHLDTLTYKTKPNGILLEIHSKTFPDQMTRIHYREHHQIATLHEGDLATQYFYLDDGRVDSYAMNTENKIKTKLVYDSNKILIATEGYAGDNQLYRVKLNYNEDGLPVTKEMYLIKDGKEELSGHKQVYVYD